jgi:nitrate reductase gamma subunit
MTFLGKILIAAAYGAYAAFWIRFLMHALVWWKARRHDAESLPVLRSGGHAWVLTAADVLLFNRLLNVNAALWIGEWVFHASLLLVLLRHLRYFLNPIPLPIWWAQTPGLIAGYVLLFSLLYILFIRTMTKHEKYSSPLNVFLLGLVLSISAIGLLMQTLFKPDLVNVKLFILGILGFAPAAAPESVLFLLHFSLFLVLLPLLPTHIISAPLVMIEARRREQALHLVMHEK